MNPQEWSEDSLKQLESLCKWHALDLDSVLRAVSRGVTGKGR